MSTVCSNLAMGIRSFRLIQQAMLICLRSTMILPKCFFDNYYYGEVLFITLKQGSNKLLPMKASHSPFSSTHTLAIPVLATHT